MQKPPTTVAVVKGQSVGDKLPTPVREGYLFNGWSTSKYGWGMGTAFTADTAVSADQTVYATWTIDPDVFGYTFSYPNGTGTYYADITIEEESGKTAIKYSNVGKDNHAYVTADVRKVMLHITASAGDVVSMKLKVPTGSTAGTKFVICNASGTELTTVFTDAQGNVAENGNLTLGQWYTLSWVSDGTTNYQIRPFEANSASGSFYMADINVVSFTYTASEGKYYAQISRDVVDGEAVSKYTNTNVHSAVYPKHRKVYINIAHQLGDTISMKVMLGDVSNVNGTNLTTNTLAIHPKDSDTPLAVTFMDEQGNVVADGELTEGVWYTMTFKGSGISAYDIRPFKGVGDTGVFYMKNIQVIEPQMEDDDFNPTLRFAITSDTHLFNRYQGSATQEAHLANLFTVSYGYARRSAAYKNLDAVLVAGDLSEGDAGEFVMFKNIVDANIQPGTQLIVGMGNHDFRGGLDPAAWTEDAAKQLEAAFKTTFGLESADQHVVINGYHFISLSPNAENLGNNVGESYSEAKLAWLEEEIQAAIAEDATKPVFVMQHHHPSGTVYGSGAAGGKQADLFNLLSKYPQVVDFSGHSHYPINDPRNVWQDAFTAIGTGTLFYTGFDINGGPTGVYPDGYQGDYSTSGSKNGADYGVFQIVEVNADNDIRIIVYDLRTFEELYRFVIENPVDPANHVTNEQKAEASKAPEFALGAEVEVREVDGISYVYVPQAISTEVIESYRAYVTVNGVTTTYYGLSGYVYPNQPEYARIKIGSLDTTKDYRIEVVAVNAYGKESTRSLVLDATAPKAEITYNLNFPTTYVTNSDVTQTVIQEYVLGGYYRTLLTPTTEQTPYYYHNATRIIYYTFQGWYLNADCTGEPVKVTDVVDGPKTLFAKWLNVSVAQRNSGYADPVLKYIDGEWVYFIEGSQYATATADQKALNMRITPASAYALHFMFKMENPSGDATVGYSNVHGLTARIYDENWNLVAAPATSSAAVTQLNAGQWYHMVYTYGSNAVMGVGYWGLGNFGGGTGGVDVYIKDISVTESPAPSTTDVDIYSSNSTAFPNRTLQPIDGEWVWVFAGSQTQTAHTDRFLKFNIKRAASKITFKLMMDNCTGEVTPGCTSAGGSITVIFKDPDTGAEVPWTELQAGVWYDCLYARPSGNTNAMGVANAWNIGYFGIGTGGLNIYVKDIVLTPA